MVTTSCLWENIENIQKILEFSDQRIAEILELDFEYFFLSKRYRCDIGISDITKFANYFGISLNDLLFKNIDAYIVKRKFYNGDVCLPERYNYGKLSKAFSLKTWIDFLTIKFGRSFCENLFLDLGVKVDYFENIDNKININFVSDLVMKLQKMGFNTHDFKVVGRNTYFSTRNTHLGDYLATHTNQEDLMDDLCTNLSHLWDENFDYKLNKLSTGELVVEISPSEKGRDLLGQNVYGNPFACDYKMGIFETFPKFIGKQKSIIEKKSCIYQGDIRTQYLITA